MNKAVLISALALLCVLPCALARKPPALPDGTRLGGDLNASGKAVTNLVRVVFVNGAGMVMDGVYLSLTNGAPIIISADDAQLDGASIEVIPGDMSSTIRLKASTIDIIGDLAVGGDVFILSSSDNDYAVLNRRESDERFFRNDGTSTNLAFAAGMRIVATNGVFNFITGD